MKKTYLQPQTQVFRGPSNLLLVNGSLDIFNNLNGYGDETIDDPDEIQSNGFNIILWDEEND